ncbi:MAG: hypothetical protein MI700_06655, partial [Balneolales bacterium]|nr:hypothetical protein [Balneolales bacterium]
MRSRGILLFSNLLAVSLMISSSLLAQSGNSTLGRGGSVYSSLGLGYPIENTSAAARGQGILDITAASFETSSLANPALWGHSFYTLATTGLTLDATELSNGIVTDRSTNLQNAYLHLVLPLKPGRLGASLALYPVTRASYKTVITSDFNASPSETVTYENEVETTGGLNKLEIGFGWKLSDNISIGYAPSLAFLSLQESENILFNTSGFDTHYQELNTTGVAFSQRFGVTATLDELFMDDDKFSVGATLNLPFTIKAKQNYISEKIVEGVFEEVDLSDQLENSEGDITLPFEAALGIGYAPSTFLNFSAEAQIQNWGDFEDELSTEDESYFKNRLKMGFGAEYRPHVRGMDSFFSRFKYSAGLSYDTGHLTIENEDISTLWINTGIGIPSRSPRVFSFIDFSVQYGFRGSTGINL